VPITSNDEASILTDEFNKNTELIWKNTQELLLKQKQIQELVDKEKLLGKITETIRSTLDLDQVLNNICQELLELYKVDRVAIASYSIEEDSSEWSKHFEVKTGLHICGVKEIDFSSESKMYLKTHLLEKDVDLIVENLENSDLPDYFKDTYQKMNVKSILAIPIKRENDKWGAIGLFQNESRKWTQYEIDFLHKIVDQIFIAVKQAELFLITKKQVEKESLLRNIIGSIRSTLDINEVKNEIVTGIGKALDVDKCFIVEFNQTNNKFISIEYEYLTNPEFKSNIGLNVENYAPEIAQKEKEINEVIISDSEKFIKENNFENTATAKYLRDFHIKYIFSIRLTYADQFLGMLIIQNLTKKEQLNEDTIEFLRILSGQVSIAFYQAKLFNTIKLTADREALLRKITETIRSSLDIDETLNIICDEVAKLVNVQRATIVEFPDPQNYEDYLIRREYKISPEVKGLSNIEYEKKAAAYWGKKLLRENVDIIIDNIELFDTPDYFKKTYNALGVKSIIGFPIRKGENAWGTFVLSEYNYYRHWTEEEVNLLRTIADQIYIAIKQAELFSITKESADREKALREIISTIRSTLDINGIKRTFVNEIGTFFKADRVVIADYDYKTNDYAISTEGEYRSSDRIKTFIKCDFSIIPGFIEYIRDIHLQGKDIIFNDLEKYLDENNLRGTGAEKFYREYGYVSSAAINIYYRDTFLGDIVITFKKQRNFSDDDIKFIKTLADQAGVAIYQSMLYKSATETAEREVLLRNIISTIRSTLDINEIKRTFVNEIGAFFKADRIIFSEFNAEKKVFLPTDENSEYLADTTLGSLIGYDWGSEKVLPFIQLLNEQGEIDIADLDKYLKEHGLENTDLERLFREWRIKSSYNILIMYSKEIMGFFCIDYIKEKHEISAEELEFLRTLTNQAGIALYQSQLYLKVQQTVKKERLLREIISELKIFQTFDQAYKYTLEKMTEIFDVERAIFVEIPEYKYGKPSIKYEYMRNQDLLSMINKQLPDSSQQMFIEIANDYKTISANNIEEFYADDEKAQKFFKDNNIKSFIASPFIKHDKEVKIFGTIVLCSTKVRIWSSKEVELLKSIVESVVIVLWEILKLNEINELRDIFILTLAHDLQVPLVGEKKALEYLANRPSDQPIGKFKEFIGETIESNKILFNLLTRLLDSYYYESNKKSLNFIEYNMKTVIDKAISSLQNLANSKSMNITVEIEKDLPDIKMDRTEIGKVLYYLIENSIMYTQPGGQIVVKSYRQDNNIITCITDNGPGIEPETREKIFKRYEMAAAIERKIGAGLSLYLTKQIVEAHKGKIWYETELGKGTTFCVQLPIERK
ncbi:MAG: GAF domain-containing sensor histidine kinase, partial [Candidatus Gastranaerophilales bacterium]|nr:GAF domain-containing sensor histidine kinase [Candidatus Gastranaerophilales bacterium]